MTEKSQSHLKDHIPDTKAKAKHFSIDPWNTIVGILKVMDTKTKALNRSLFQMPIVGKESISRCSNACQSKENSQHSIIMIMDLL